jgi:hypothetical protein
MSSKKKDFFSSSPVKTSTNGLTEEEMGWVGDIQTTLEKISRQNGEDFGKISDFELVQHVIVAKGKEDVVLKRMRRLKLFREKHGIDKIVSVYGALKMVSKFVDAHKGFLQSLGTDPMGRPIVALNFAALHPSQKDLEDDNRFAVFYFLLCAMQSDLFNIRNGIVVIGDFTNVTWQNNLSFGLLRGTAELCRDSFPIKVKDIPLLNAPSTMSSMYAMCWSYLSPKVVQRLHMDCSLQILKDAFPSQILPKSLGGSQGPLDMMDHLEEALKRRFENDQSFRLVTLDRFEERAETPDVQLV